MNIDRHDVLTKLLDAARAASEIVMRIYLEADVGAELKGPNDPVTRADKEANVRRLLSVERHRRFEDPPDSRRRRLDGTANQSRNDGSRITSLPENHA